MLIKPVSPPGSPARYYLFYFTSFIEMHLLERPDLGHSMIYYDGKLEEKR